VRNISEQELKDILDKHGKWLRDESGGERANLSFADLSSANLRSANLISANLSFADLSFADLSSANLRSANLISANLSFADLSFADLRGAVGFEFKPLQIVNTKYFITILDDKVLWGCREFSFDQVKSITINDCTEKWDEKELEFNKKIILELIEFYRAKGE
jgi:hypothetical protein